MRSFPVITGFGGINPAGRSSGFHGYRRLVFDALSTEKQQRTLQNLAGLCNTNASDADKLLAATLIRRLEDSYFDVDAVPYHQQAALQGDEREGLVFTMRRKHLPDPIPESWELTPGEGDSMQVKVTDKLDVMLGALRVSEVQAAGQLPGGFDPASTYNSRNHPRALQMTVFGASDAIQSLGMDWDTLQQLVPADQISVYAGSCLSQLDYNGNGGMLQARLLGKKVTSKQLALGLNEMPADFINAYLLGNLGTTGHSNGACATFLYNLRNGIRDIRNGQARIAIVGTSEAGLVPEVFDAFATMGALATDASLRKLDGLSAADMPDYARACRPFSDNSGFTIAESAQFIVLMDDKLALETGATIYGGVNDVFVNADGYKKSITGPGLGNYITLSKAAAATANIIGEKRLSEASFVQAHGTGTPQNRVTESEILSTVAKAFGIESWPVAAIKSYVGHSVASAAGDQLMACLGVWNEGILPGILTIEGLADDVERAHLDYLLAHRELKNTDMDAAIINSKGFGGNNASASIIAPHIVSAMLEKRHGKSAFTEHRKRNEKVAEAAAEYDDATCRGEHRTIYRFDHNVLGSEALEVSRTGMKVNGYANTISLQVPDYYADMLEDPGSSE